MITSPHGRALQSSIRKTLELIAEHAKSQPQEVAALLDGLAGHLRSISPMSFAAVDPIGELRVNLSPDGAHVHFYVRESHFGMCLHDALGDSATVVCEPQAGERMIVAAQRVLGAVGPK